MFDDQDPHFIFMPFASEVQVEPFTFKWGSVPCTFDEATRTLTAEDPAVESDPRLHSWLQSIFG